jgi:hypothetical protein
MPRNHRRINQTSTTLIQSWRGNCDVQILIYESHPDNFDPREVSKVTDYVVAYSCKAAVSQREEMETIKRLILATEETTGDQGDLISLCKRITNKSSSSRLISRAEASVLLGGLDLSVCSEYIDSVSITNNLRISKSGQQNDNKGLLWKYANRRAELENYSLHAYYTVYRSATQGKKPYIPHYVGIKGIPTYPVSEAYARHVLIVYKPWRTYPSSNGWLQEFETFIHSQECPTSARLTYKRVLQRYYDGTKFAEATAKEPPASREMTLPLEDEEILLLAGLGGLPDDADHDLDMQAINRGIDFKFDVPPKVSTTYSV